MSNYFNQESVRLFYRPLSMTDVESWLEFFDDNPNIGFIGLDFSKSYDELAHQWIAKQIERYEDCGLGHLAVLEKSSNSFIAMAGIIPREMNGVIEHEIAYSIKPKFWRRGYGTEMANHMRTYGQDVINLSRLISIIHVENEGSIKVAQRNQMKLWYNIDDYMGMPCHVYSTHIT